MNNRSTLLILLTTLLLVAAAAPAALAQAEVRAMGVGGAWTAMSRGLESVTYNPANLQLGREHFLFLGVDAAFGLQTNSFALDMYNSYSGEFITTQDKLDILAEIPDEGMVLDFGTQTSLFGAAVGPFALSLQAIANMKGTIDKDLFNLVMLGNDLDQTFVFDDTDAAGSALAAATISYALPLYTSLDYRVVGGVNYRYLMGFANFEVEDAVGNLSTYMHGFEGSASGSAVTAEGGSGHAIDFGVSVQAPRGWTFGMALSNMSSNITWDEETERHEFTVAFDSLSSATEDIDEAVADNDTTYAIGSYDTKLPKVLRIGASNVWRDFTYGIDLEMGLDDEPGSAKKTALNMGCEWQAFGWLRPRLGMGFGGRYSGHSSIGLGIYLGPLHIDWAVANRGRIMPGDTKGLATGLGVSLRI